MERFEAIAAEVADLVLEYGGALSGEHGDGLVRAPFQEKMFGTAIYNAFCEVKAAFDPSNMLNPGKIVHAPALTSNLAARRLPTRRLCRSGNPWRRPAHCPQRH